MINILLVPSSDYIGHPFPQRYNQIFERINDKNNYNVHVLNNNIFNKKNIPTKVQIYNINHVKSNNLAIYYTVNSIKYASTLRQIIVDKEIDVLIFSNFATPLLYYIINQFNNMNTPIIFDVPDYYPTSASGYITDINKISGKMLTGGFETIFRYLLKKSDKVTTVSAGLVNYSKNIGAKSVTYIPNGISEHFFDTKDKQKIRKNLGYSPDDFIVGYIGSIEFWCDFEPLIISIKKIKEEGIPVKLLLVGKSLHTNYDEKVMNWLKKYNIYNITTWMDFIPYNEVPHYMATLDIGTIPFNINNPTAYYSAPNKLWEYASQMVPIISTSIPEAYNNRKILTLVNNAKEYFDAIIHIYKNKDLFDEKLEQAKITSLKMTWNKSKNLMLKSINGVI